MERQRREVVKTSNLILHLEDVCEVFTRRNWTCCAINPVFKRIPSLLNSIPTNHHVFKINPLIDRKQNHICNQQNVLSVNGLWSSSISHWSFRKSGLWSSNLTKGEGSVRVYLFNVSYINKYYILQKKYYILKK